MCWRPSYASGFHVAAKEAKKRLWESEETRVVSIAELLTNHFLENCTIQRSPAMTVHLIKIMSLIIAQTLNSANQISLLEVALPAVEKKKKEDDE